jgi:hypothetical protein
MAQRADGQRDLELGMRAAFVNRRTWLRRGDYRLGLLVERRPALATVIADGPKLDKVTMVASHYFP